MMATDSFGQLRNRIWRLLQDAAIDRDLGLTDAPTPNRALTTGAACSTISANPSWERSHEMFTEGAE